MTDEELIHAFRHPEKVDAAFADLIRQYQRPIYFFIRRMVVDHDDADDLTQVTFIQAWKGMAGFRGDAKLSTWLHTIAYRESIHFLEKKKRLGKVSMDQVEYALEGTLHNDPLYEGDEIHRRLQVAVALLPEKQKAVFVMKYFEEKKYEEIAAITGTSVGALKASFHHAVQKIEHHLLNTQGA